MAKRIQLVLNQDVSKLGRAGDLVEVAPGYARNYLIPNKLGVNATPSLLKQVERRREKERQRQAELKQQSQEVKAALEKVGSFTIAKQVAQNSPAFQNAGENLRGEGDAIFGTVTDREVAAVIQETVGTEVDRRGITLPDISSIGTYKAEIKLHPEVTATVEIQVVAQ